MPRVSILLTCYNHLAHLPAALESIRAQTYTDYEVLAIDDGSTDGTREWLAQQEGLQVVLTPKNLGTYGALNFGLSKAGGEFFAILNDDDLWAPRKLEAQVAMMDAHPEVGLVHTDGGFIDGEGKPLEGTPLGFRFPRFETGDLLTALYYENKIIASAALFRRSVVEKVGNFNESYFGSGDWEMWLRIAEVADVGFVPEPLTSYRVHGAQASHKLERIWKDDEKLREWIASRELAHLNRLENRNKGGEVAQTMAVVQSFSKAVAHNWACLGTVRMLNSNPKGARQAYMRSLKLDPSRWQSLARWLMTFGSSEAFKRSVLRKNTHGLG